MPDASEFAGKITAERIRKLRQERNLSQRELAQRVGISAAYLSQIENGTRHLNIDLLLKFKAVTF